MTATNALAKPTASGTTPLVLSYTGVLGQLIHRKLTIQALDGALFYMGCGKSHIFDAEAFEGYTKHADKNGWTPEERHELYSAFCELVTKAEAEGRAHWRPDNGDSSWGGLNELLKANGGSQIDPTSYHYSYGGVEDAIQTQGLPYNVAHHC